jgi:hypothetical protein
MRSLWEGFVRVALWSSRPEEEEDSLTCTNSPAPTHAPTPEPEPELEPAVSPNPKPLERDNLKRIEVGAYRVQQSPRAELYADPDSRILYVTERVSTRKKASHRYELLQRDSVLPIIKLAASRDGWRRMDMVSLAAHYEALFWNVIWYQLSLN